MMTLAACATLLVACGSRPACPAHFTTQMMGDPCHLGAICMYRDVAMDIACVCRNVPTCRGGARTYSDSASGSARPTPPESRVTFVCTTPACVGAAAGEPCPHEGESCAGPVCNSYFECQSGRWSFVQHGPPP
jgi:hypothetical protein